MKLSVILPVYNVEKYIYQCVESLFLQKLEECDFEVILVNDGTPDNSMSVVKPLADKHFNIRVINQENQGVSVARNRGLQEAKGEWVLFVDPDDVIVPDSLSSLLDEAVNGEVDVLVGGYVKMNNREIEDFFSEQVDKYPTFSSDLAVKSEMMDGETYFCDRYDPTVGYAWVNLYKREFLNRFHLMFCPGVSFTEDTLFTIRVFLHVSHVVRSTKIFYIYRQHAESVISTMTVKKLLSVNTVIAELVSLDKSGEPLSDRCLKKKEKCVFLSLSVMLWYLSHYDSLIGQRKIVVSDLKKKAPHLFLIGSVKQIMTSLLYCLTPSWYIYLRYLFARRKY